MFQRKAQKHNELMHVFKSVGMLKTTKQIALRQVIPGIIPALFGRIGGRDTFDITVYFRGDPSDSGSQP